MIERWCGGLIYNVKSIHYDNFTTTKLFAKPIIKKEEEKKENLRKDYKNEERTEKEKIHCLEVSLNATKNRLYNIVYSNKWDYFITMTFDQKGTKTGKPIDSSNYELCLKKLKIFIDNLKKRKCPDLQYIIVPELHSDKVHYHFHGLLSNCEGLILEDSGHKTEDEQIIYNLPQWTYGFTTATKVKDNDKVSSYLAKYISKDNFLKIPNKKRYLCSKGLERKEPVYENVYPDVFIEEIKDKIDYCKTRNIPEAYQQIKYFTLKNKDYDSYQEQSVCSEA